MKLDDKLREAISAINGQDADEVATIIYACGIRGYRASTCSCPVANFIRAYLGADVAVHVTHMSVTVRLLNSVAIVGIPSSIRMFITHYDIDYQYRELRPEGIVK